MFDLIALAIALAVVGALVFVFGNRHERRSDSQELYRDLLRKCAGDKDAVERLIEGEKKRNPTASRDELFKLASERWRQQSR